MEMMTHMGAGMTVMDNVRIVKKIPDGRLPHVVITTHEAVFHMFVIKFTEFSHFLF